MFVSAADVMQLFSDFVHLMLSVCGRSYAYRGFGVMDTHCQVCVPEVCSFQNCIFVYMCIHCYILLLLHIHWFVIVYILVS